MSAGGSTPGPRTIHATALVVGEAGVLLRGPSGAGKSLTTLTLLDLCATRGVFARLVADDRVALRVAGGRLVAAPHPALAGRIERRGQGIEDVPHLSRAAIGLVVDLLAPGVDAPRLPEPDAERVDLLGVALPRLALQGGAAVVAAAVMARLRGGAGRA